MSSTSRRPETLASMCSRTAATTGGTKSAFCDENWICTGLPTGGPSSIFCTSTVMPASDAVTCRARSRISRPVSRRSLCSCISRKT